MASYQQMYYCKICKKNVSVDENNKCVACHGTQLKKSWSVRFRYIQEDGKEVQKRISGKQTKKEAQEAYLEFISSNKKYCKTEDIVRTLTFAQLYEEYKKFTQNRIKQSSYYDFCSKCNIHILPYFNNYKIIDITPKIILEWQNSKNGYSYKYKTGLRMYLSSILGYAEKYYGIANKVRQVDNFRNVELKKEMLFWTPEEFNSFIACVDQEVYKTFFYALYYTGARKGEILATNWQDWNLQTNTLRINKTVTKKVYGASWIITVPKNQTSIRTITLPSNLVEIIKEYKKGREDYDFVFAEDKPLADSSIGRVQLEACEKSGVKKIRLHDFRHSHASLLLSQGASIVAVAKRLGHSNIEQTLNTYAHMMPNEDEILLSILEKTAKNNIKSA